MKYLLDANILVCAFNDDAAEHGAVMRWLGPVLGGAQEIATTDIVDLAFLRVAMLTHRMRSSILEEAFEFLARIHERPSATRIAPGAGHAGLFRDLCRRHSIRGNDVYDAFLAALALEHRATLVTHDRGFLRFEGMSLFDPLAMPGMDEAGIAYRARRRKRA